MRLPFVMSALALGNLLLGLSSMFMVYHRMYESAALTIMAAVAVDTIDAQMARKLRNGTTFPKELDSLTDLVTFGVAPAILIYSTVLHQFHVIGIIVTAIYPIFGALALARFNIHGTSEPKTFSALPIAVAGGFLAVLVLYRHNLDATFPYALLIIMMVLAYLMVNNVKQDNKGYADEESYFD